MFSSQKRNDNCDVMEVLASSTVVITEAMQYVHVLNKYILHILYTIIFQLNR